MQLHLPYTTISALHFRQQLTKVIQQVVVEKKNFQIEKNGLPVMFVMPVEEYQRLIAKTQKDI